MFLKIIRLIYFSLLKTKITGKTKRLKCQSANCVCDAFAYIPSRPDEAGEFWLAKRPGFDPSTWRAKCKCGHAHDRHEPKYKRCKGMFLILSISSIHILFFILI